MNLDQSLAFTALIEMWPGYAEGTDDGGSSLVATLAASMTVANPPDRWAFARQWIETRRGLSDALAADGIPDPTRRPPAEPGAWESIAESLATMGVDVCRAADDLHRIADATAAPGAPLLAAARAAVDEWRNTPAVAAGLYAALRQLAAELVPLSDDEDRT